MTSSEEKGSELREHGRHMPEPQEQKKRMWKVYCTSVVIMPVDHLHPVKSCKLVNSTASEAIHIHILKGETPFNIINSSFTIKRLPSKEQGQQLQSKSFFYKKKPVSRRWPSHISLQIRARNQSGWTREVISRAIIIVVSIYYQCYRDFGLKYCHFHHSWRIWEPICP